jgi:hypothetical protein
LWERAAEAAVADASWSTAVANAGRAADHHRQAGDTRLAARAEATAGQALRLWGRHAEARDRLTAAVEVLRAEPDTDTVRALAELAILEAFAGSADADRLSTEALVLGEALATTWPMPSPTWSRPSSSSANGTPPKPSWRMSPIPTA